MKTDDLIKALAADVGSVEPPIARTLAGAVAIGALLALGLFLWQLGLRQDFSEVASSSGRFLFKFVLTLSVAVPAFLIIRGLARPDFAAGNKLRWLALAPVLLAGGILFELASVPSGDWHARLVGHNSIACLTIIPLLALAPFAAVLYALKSGAPANPTIAGAVGGLLSAGIAATLYASHCTDDSPLFVGAWYSIGFILMAVLGAFIGSRLLRW